MNMTSWIYPFHYCIRCARFYHNHINQLLRLDLEFHRFYCMFYFDSKIYCHGLPIGHPQDICLEPAADPLDAEGNQAEATIRTRGGTDPRDETDHYRRCDAYNRKA